MGVLRMTAEQEAILAELRLHTRQSPITRRELAEKLGMEDRPMRHHIESLAKVFLQPIGRSSHGYYWRESLQDDAITFDLLVKKIRAMARECKLIKEQMAARGQRLLEG